MLTYTKNNSCLLVIKGLMTLILLFGGEGFGQGVPNQPMGGPDQFGYRWQTQQAINGPVYNWIDITLDGTEITGLADDNSAGPIDLGFNFNFYGEDNRYIWVGSNGWLHFSKTEHPSPGNLSSPFNSIPTNDVVNNLIGMMISDLIFAINGVQIPSAKAFYKQLNSSVFVLSFIDVPFWTDGDSLGYRGSNTFQCILNKNTGEITVQYKKCSPSTDQDSFYTQVGSRWMICGIENKNGNIGLSAMENFDIPERTVLRYKRVNISKISGNVYWDKNGDGIK